MRILAVLTAAAVGLSFVAVGDADAQRKGKGKAKCVLAAGQGTGIEQGIARSMAKTALDQSIAKNKWKARGKVAYKCSGGLLLPSCTASQRACS